MPVTEHDQFVGNHDDTNRCFLISVVTIPGHFFHGQLRVSLLKQRGILPAVPKVQYHARLLLFNGAAHIFNISMGVRYNQNFHHRSRISNHWHGKTDVFRGFKIDAAHAKEKSFSDRKGTNAHSTWQGRLTYRNTAVTP